MKTSILLFISVFVWVVSIQTKVGAQPSENKLAWFQDAKFGLFIHWGVYSKLAGEWKGKSGYNEFVMLGAKIPIMEYEKVAKTLNPVNFNAEAWALAAKNAGMKYLVITSKHHEGFAMFNSPSDPYNIVDFTPFQRDGAGNKNRDTQTGA